MSLDKEVKKGGTNMAVKIRLKRMGKKKKPFYRLVHAGLYVEVMESVFSKLVNFESKTESKMKHYKNIWMA